MKSLTMRKAFRILILIVVLAGLTYSINSLFGTKVQAFDTCGDCEIASEEAAWEAIMSCSGGSGNPTGCEAAARNAKGQYCVTHCSPCSFCAEDMQMQ